MYLSTSYERNDYSRTRNGQEETVKSKIKVYNLSCDVCEKEFKRTSKQMKPNRANNSVSHVCKDCDAKRFAQKQSQFSKRIKKYDASSDIPIDTIINNC